MAKEVKETKMVTVTDLAAEFNCEAREIRVLLRANGMKAPAVEAQEGKFGPRAKYQWKEGSKELAEVKRLIKEALEAGEEEADDADEGETEAAPAKTAKKGK